MAINKKMTNSNNGSDRLDLLVDQIGRLTEQIAQSSISITNGFAETRANIEKLGERIDSGFAQTSANIDKLGEKIDSGFSELKAISQAQQQDINRLVEVTDRQAQTVDRQAKTVDKQAQTVDRLALMLERVLSEPR